MMQSLGVKPQSLSGAGWLEKEDGESDRFIVQLKSTKSKSMVMTEQAVKDLIYHANIAHKIPVFVNDIVGKRTMVSVPLEFLDEFVKAIGDNNNGSKLEEDTDQI